MQQNPLYLPSWKKQGTLESLPADQGQDQKLPEEVRPAGRGRPLQGLQNAWQPIKRVNFQKK